MLPTLVQNCDHQDLLLKYQHPLYLVVHIISIAYNHHLMAPQLSDPVNQQEYRDILCLSTHKMASKLQAFTKFSSKIPQHFDWNNRDQKFDELVTNAENICSHFKSCCLEYHPTIVPWIRQTIVSWLVWLHDGKITNIGNLIWAVIEPWWKCLCCVMLADSPQITFLQSTC